MALTEDRPILELTAGEAQREPLGTFRRPTAITGWRSWITTVDHKKIGIMYGATALVFFAIGGLEALLIRAQLAQPDGQVLSPQAYNQAFTLHGTTMVFLVIMPLLAAFSNYLIPLQIGARDVAFPRLNAMSFWIFLFAGLFIYSGTNQNLTVPWAHWVVPTAAYVEKDGTFVNCHGRVQRIGRVFPPRNNSREDWRILLDLGGRLGLPLDWRSPERIFLELAKACAPFEGMSYETIGAQGVQVAPAKPAPRAVAP